MRVAELLSVALPTNVTLRPALAKFVYSFVRYPPAAPDPSVIESPSGMTLIVGGGGGGVPRWTSTWRFFTVYVVAFWANVQSGSAVGRLPMPMSLVPDVPPPHRL